MKLESPAFQEGQRIPHIYTCRGKNISPPLSIQGAPPHTKSLALIMDDPDVPASIRSDRMWDHWIVYDLPPTLLSLSEGADPPGTQGRNTGGHNRYQGPCPPDREHRYFFKLYALDKKLELPPGASKLEVEKAMQGHILAECHLMGLYEQPK